MSKAEGRKRDVVRCCIFCLSVVQCCAETGVMWQEFKEGKIARYGREFCTKTNARRKFPIINWIPKYR